MTSKEQLISIVIPTYNNAAVIKETLQSLLVQTWQNWEALVVNNGSTDNTVEVVSSIGDSRIKLVDCPRDPLKGGIAAARNMGLRHAKGDWVAFLDSDDVWYPTKLTACSAKFEDSDVICHRVDYFEDNGKKRPAFQRVPNGNVFEFLVLEENFLVTSSVVCRKSLLEKLGGFCEAPEIVTAEDYDLWIRLAKENARFSVIDEALAKYRIHSSNSTSNSSRHFKAVYAVLLKHKNQFDASYEDRWQKRFAMLFYGCARNIQRVGGKRREVLFYLVQSLKRDGSLWRAYASLAMLFFPRKLVYFLESSNAKRYNVKVNADN